MTHRVTVKLHLWAEGVDADVLRDHGPLKTLTPWEVKSCFQDPIANNQWQSWGSWLPEETALSPTPCSTLQFCPKPLVTGMIFITNVGSKYGYIVLFFNLKLKWGRASTWKIIRKFNIYFRGFTLTLHELAKKIEGIYTLREKSIQQGEPEVTTICYCHYCSLPHGVTVEHWAAVRWTKLVHG